MIPDTGFVHPIVVHFAIALLVVGVLFRCAALAGRPAFAGPAAATLVLVAAAASVVAAYTGEDASVPALAVPDAAAAVAAHEHAGRRTRNLALATAACELAVLALAGRGARRASVASALVGLAAVASVLDAGRLGGELVYAHAAGVGTRSGDPADVERLLLAGLVRQADVDERAGRSEEAAALIETAVRRFPSDPEVALLDAEMLLDDRNDAAAALGVLDRLDVAGAASSLRFRQEWLTVDALDALGRRGEAAAVLDRLGRDFPDNPRVRARIARAAS